MKKKYQRSAESDKASQEFKYAMKVVSPLLRELKHVTIRKDPRGLYNNLVALVIKILNTGPSECKGNRKLSDGDVSLFRGFKMNTYLHLFTLTEFRPEVYIAAKEKYIELSTPPLNKHDFNPPLRARAADIRFQLIILDAEDFTAESILTDSLMVPLDKKGISAKRVKIPMPNSEDKVVILSMSVFIHLKQTQNNETFISGNRNHMAGEIIDAVYIKDGAIVPFIAQEKSQERKIISEKPKETIPWVDI